MRVDGGRPFAQPVRERADQAGALFGMAFQDRPLARVGRLRIVEDRGGHGELADVMEERRPSQSVGVVRIQAHVARDEVGERPHSLAVTTRAVVVSVERGGEGHHTLGGLGCSEVLAIGLQVVGPPPQLADGTGAQGDREPRWRLVGERHREAQEAGEGQDPPADPVGREDDDERDDAGQHPTEQAELLRSDPACHEARRDDREDDRNRGGRNPEREGSPVPRVPTARRAPISDDLLRHSFTCRPRRAVVGGASPKMGRSAHDAP